MPHFASAAARRRSLRPFALLVVLTAHCGHPAPVADVPSADAGDALDAPAPADASPDAPPDIPADLPCLAPNHLCGGACVYPLTDPEHCGACDVRCGAGSTCMVGECTRPTTCDAAAVQHAPIGCEYWAAGIAHSQLRTSLFQFGVGVASPPDATGPTQVTIDGGGLTAPVMFTLAPGESHLAPLPWVHALVQSESGTDPPTAATSVIAPGAAYRIRSDRPVWAYQFSPLQFAATTGTDVQYAGTADASALRPVHALGTHYVAASWPALDTGTMNGSRVFGGALAVVATTDGPTTVTVRTQAAIVAGSMVPAASMGNTLSYTLMRGDVLQLMTGGRPGLASTPGCTIYSDLTGSIVTTDHPVALFTGHDCANVPCNLFTCDHLEEQQAPDAAWGTEYVVMVPRDRTDSDTALVRVISGGDGNMLGFDGTVAPGPCLAPLNAGRMCEFETDLDVLIRGTQPFAVEVFARGGGMRDATACGPGVGGPMPTDRSCYGDPSLVLPPPTSRFALRYSVVVPPGWPRTTLVLAYPTRSTVLVDGMPPPAGRTLGTSGLSITAMVVTGGVHHLEGTSPFGVTVWGAGNWTSYGYAPHGVVR